MSEKSMQNMVLLAKLEVTPGVDPTPTPAANSMLVRSFMPTPITAEFVKRNLVRGFKGNFGQLAVGVHRMIEVEVELAGSGTAGNAPKWAPLIMASSFSQTLSAGVSATYQMVSTGASTATLYGYLDGILFKMTNCKGTVAFELNAKAIPVMKYKFIGEYHEMEDVTMPTGMVFTGFQKPLTVGKVNTPTFTVHGLSGACQAMGFDTASKLVWRDLVGKNGPSSNSREPTCNLTIELPTVAAADFAESARQGTEGAISLVHGLVAGNIITIDAPKAQITAAPTISNDDDTAMLGLQMSLNPDAGNDEIVVVAR